MKRSCFSKEQIIAILEEHEAGASVADLCRKHGVGAVRIYKVRQPDNRSWTTTTQAALPIEAPRRARPRYSATISSS